VPCARRWAGSRCRVTTTTFVFLDESTTAQRQEHIANVRQQFVQALEIHGIPHQLDIAIGVLPAVDDIAGSDVVRSLLTVIDVGREEGVCPRQFESVHAENQRTLSGCSRHCRWPSMRPMN
jgi:hypothetical protein